MLKRDRRVRERKCFERYREDAREQGVAGVCRLSMPV